MRFRYDEDMKKTIMVYATSLIIAVVVGMCVFNIGTISTWIQAFMKAALPFIVGLGLAIILRKPVAFIEEKVFHNFKRKRLWAGFVVFALFILLLILLISLIVPNVISSITDFLSNNAKYSKNFNHYLNIIQKNYDIKLPEIDFNALFNSQNISKSVSKHISVIADYSIALVKFFINGILAIVSAFYMILDKEQLKKTFKKLNYGLFNIRVARVLSLLVITAKDVFDKFIVGSIIDSTIIGILCFVGVKLLGLPYAPMIAFIVGVTNIIPVFGPFLGAIPSAFLLVLINPIYALIFLIFIFALQQFDGNILKPIVLGDQLGLSGFWILFSVTVGGGLAGIPGMFLGVPCFALIYQVIGELMEDRLKDKKIDIDEEV